MFKPLFIIFIFLYLFPAFALELVQNNGIYQLKGACKEALAEVAQFSAKTPNCQCSKNTCYTELNSLFSDRIQNALTQPQKNGAYPTSKPNCFGTVLHEKKIQNTLAYNQSDMSVWLASPLCKRVVGPPSAGDIIHIHWFTEFEEYDEEAPKLKNHYLGDTHSYLALSKLLAFNKSSPDENDPFEIITNTEYQDRQTEYDEPIPSECRFIDVAEAKKRKCALFSVVYRCDMESLQKFQPAQQKLKDAIKKSNDICLLNRKSLEEDKPLDNVLLQINALKEEAKKALSIPAFKTLPNNLKLKIREYDYVPTLSEDQPYLEDWTKVVLMLAAPDMNIEHRPFLSEAALLARKLQLYSPLSSYERLAWFKILNIKLAEKKGQKIFCD